MKEICWGIIGCGDVTEVKSGPALQKAEGSQLMAVMRRDATKAEDYARRHGVPRWYTDADALIHDRQVDAVYVATPPGAHEHYAMKVLAAGKPCYVEKPMARNASEARRMTEAFRAKSVPLFVAYYRRALPRFLKVKQILESGALGDLKKASYLWRSGPPSRRQEPLPWRLQAEHAGGGLFLDLGSHVLDLLDFLIGPLETVSGFARNDAKRYEVEDFVTVSYSQNGMQGSACWEFCCEQARSDLFELAGERGLLRFSCFGNEPIVLMCEGKESERFDLPNPPHVQQPLIQTVVDELCGVGTCPSTAMSGLRTQEVMDTLLQTYYGGREDGFWMRKWPGNAL